ncbi:MAG: glycosyltransferase family 39 protein [Chloroflexi bacterium]|nr:glycosyltransferase family 39 protein [Chloroflexota bacterium]
MILSRSVVPHDSRRYSRLFVAGIVLVFVALCVAYNVALPLFEAPDEGAHYIYVDYIARNRALPSMDELPSHEVSQPPLYYVLSAPLIAWIDRSDFSEVYRPNPGLDNGIVNDHLPKERQMPPTGVTLALRMLRLFSTVLGAITVVLVYATVKVMFNSEEVALLAMAVTAFNPKFLHMSSQFNNDIAVACAAVLSLWVGVRMVKQPGAPSWLSLLALGASVGVATATKYSGMALAAPAAFVVAWCAVSQGRRGMGTTLRQTARSVVPIFLKWGVICVVGFALTGGWLLLYNMLRYGHPLAATQFQRAHALGIRPIPLSLEEILARLPKVLTSYWGEFGHGVQFPPAVDTVMMVIAGVVAVGVVIALIRRELPQELSVLLVVGVVTFATFIIWMRNQTGTENSRLLSPAFAAVSALSAAGLLAWLPRRIRAAGVVVLSGVSVAGAVAGLFLSLIAGYATPTYLTELEIASLPSQAVARFDNGIELVAASVNPNRIVPGHELELSAYWRATQPITDVYRAVVEVRDEQNSLIGRMSQLPLAGRYATTQMEVGRVFRDEYHLEISATSRSVARVFIGWYQQRPPNTVSHVQGSGAVGAQVGLIKVRGAQPVAMIPTTPFSSTFSSIAGLEGYQVEGDTLTLFWRSLGAPAQDYTVFVHALDQNGQIIGQADAPIAYPMSLWDAGEQIVDEHHVSAITGAATLRIGLYDPATGQRLSVQDAAGTPWPDDAVDLPVVKATP